MFGGSLVPGRCESRVATAAASASGNDHSLIRGREIEHLPARFLVIDNRSHWNLQEYVLAFAPTLVRALAMTSALRLVFRIKTEMHQRVMALAGFHDHISAVTSVSA